MILLVLLFGTAVDVFLTIIAIGMAIVVSFDSLIKRGRNKKMGTFGYGSCCLWSVLITQAILIARAANTATIRRETED
jgi:hypothetical protein